MWRRTEEEESGGKAGPQEVYSLAWRRMLGQEQGEELDLGQRQRLRCEQGLETTLRLKQVMKLELG